MLKGGKGNRKEVGVRRLEGKRRERTGEKTARDILMVRSNGVKDREIVQSFNFFVNFGVYKVI